MADAITQLDAIVSQLIAGPDKTPTEESIRAAISTVRMLPDFSGITDEEAERLARELEERVGISMGIGAVVGAVDFKPWLNDARAEGLIEPYYWNRYRKLLEQKLLDLDRVWALQYIDAAIGLAGDRIDGAREWGAAAVPGKSVVAGAALERGDDLVGDGVVDAGGCGAGHGGNSFVLSLGTRMKGRAGWPGGSAHSAEQPTREGAARMERAGC